MILASRPAGAVDLRQTDPQAFLRQSNLVSLEPKAVTALTPHRGFNIITHDRDRHWMTLDIGDLKYHHDEWLWQEWLAGGDRFFFYDIGFVHLADDAITMNAYLTSAMTDPELPNLNLNFSEARQTSLVRLHNFNDVFAGFDRVHGNSLVDTFAILDGLAPWGTTRQDLDRLLLLSAQIHYGEHINYVTPSVLSLLHHMRFAPRPASPLPVFKGLDDPGGAFKKELDAEFAGDHLCQVTFPRGKMRDLPPDILDIFMLQIIDRAEERGCSAIFTVLPRQMSAIMRNYNFAGWRSLPDDANLWIFTLRVDSKEFLFTYDDCQGNLAQRAP